MGEFFFMCETILTNGRFWWFGRSSGVDIIVSSHLQPCGHFTGCTKTKKTQQQRVKGRNRQTNLKLQYSGGEVWHF